METQHYLQQRLDQEGDFRAIPIEWTVKTFEGKQSAAIAINFCIVQKWHPDTGDGQPSGWSQEWAPGYFVSGDAWVVGKDGEISAPGVQRLIDAGLWDGDWDKLSGPPPNVTVLLSVGSEDYKGKPQYRAEWINPNADQPVARSGFKPTNPDTLNSLRSRFGSATRALAGGQPSGSAPAPPQAQPQPAGAPQQPQQHDPASTAPGGATAAPAGVTAPHVEPTQAFPAGSAPPQQQTQPQPGQAPTSQQGQAPQPGGGPAGAIDPNQAPF